MTTDTTQQTNPAAGRDEDKPIFKRFVVFGDATQPSENSRERLASLGVDKDVLDEIEDDPWTTFDKVLEDATEYARQIGYPGKPRSLRTALNLMFKPIRFSSRREHHRVQVEEIAARRREEQIIRRQLSGNVVSR